MTQISHDAGQQREPARTVLAGQTACGRSPTLRESSSSRSQVPTRAASVAARWRDLEVASTRFPSLLLRVRRRSRGSATSTACPVWCAPNVPGRRRMRLRMRLGPASPRPELAPAYSRSVSPSDDRLRRRDFRVDGAVGVRHSMTHFREEHRGGAAGEMCGVRDRDSRGG